MIKHLLITLAAALALAVAASGCGSDEGTAATPLTKAAFIKAADAICVKSDKTQNAELNAYLQDHPKAQATEAGAIQMIAVAGIPPIGTEIEELGDLNAPEGEEDQVEAIWKGLEKALRTAEDDPSTVLTKADSPFAAVGKVAAQYGFKACNNAI